MEAERNHEMAEKERILRRYLDHPLYDDSDLYYNVLIDSTEYLDHRSDYSYKISVFNTLMSRWVENKDSEKQAFKKPYFPVHVPRRKRSPNRKFVKTPNRITAVVESQKNTCDTTQKQSELLLSPKQTPEKGFRLNIKLGGNIVFSVARSNCITVFPENPPEKNKRSYNEHESDSINAKKTRITESEPQTEKTIPDKLKARLQKEDTILVIKKTLTATDVNSNNIRLSIPEAQILNHFLTKEEVLWLSERDGKAVRHMYVKLVDPSGEKWDIKLAKWLMSATVVYNLLSPWKEVVAKNKLRENTPIEVYSYRKGTRIYFAVIKV